MRAMYWNELLLSCCAAVARHLGSGCRAGNGRRRGRLAAGGDHAVLVTLAVRGERHQLAVVVVQRVVVGRADLDQLVVRLALGDGYLGEDARPRRLQVDHLGFAHAGQQMLGLRDLAAGVELQPDGHDRGLLDRRFLRGELRALLG